MRRLLLFVLLAVMYCGLSFAQYPACYCEDVEVEEPQSCDILGTDSNGVIDCSDADTDIITPDMVKSADQQDGYCLGWATGDLWQWISLETAAGSAGYVQYSDGSGGFSGEAAFSYSEAGDGLTIGDTTSSDGDLTLKAYDTGPRLYFYEGDSADSNVAFGMTNGNLLIYEYLDNGSLVGTAGVISPGVGSGGSYLAMASLSDNGPGGFLGYDKGYLRLYEDYSGSNTDYWQLDVPTALTGNITWTVPSTAPSTNDFLYFSSATQLAHFDLWGNTNTWSAANTFTAEMTVDDTGIEFAAGDTLTDCSTFSSTGGGIFYDDSEGIFKKCEDNALSALDTPGNLETSMPGIEQWEFVYGGPGDDVGVFAAIEDLVENETPASGDRIFCTDSSSSHILRYCDIGDLPGAAGDQVEVNSFELDGADLSDTGDINWTVNTGVDPDEVMANLDPALVIEDGEYIDFGTNIDSATEGLFLPANASTCASATGEGQVCWNENDEDLYIGNGSSPVKMNTGSVASLGDVGDVTLTTPGDGAVLCFTGSANASVDCTVGGDLTATENSGTITYVVTDTECTGDTEYLDGAGNCDDISSVYQAADAELTTLGGLTEAQGSIIIGNATPEWSALAIGTTGAVLLSDGSTAAWDTSPALDCTDCTIPWTSLVTTQGTNDLCYSTDGSTIQCTLDLSSELANRITDSVGFVGAGDYLVFNNGPTLKGVINRTGTAVDDDECTGQQGSWWWDSTDTQFEFCNDTSGVPDVLGGVDSSAIHISTADEFDTASEKSSLVGADLILIEDSADSYNKKYVQITNLPGGSGAFSDASDPIVQNTTSKDVHIGDGAGTLTGKLEIGGDDDQPQLIVEGHSTQNDSLIIAQNDGDTQVFNVDVDGNVKAISIEDINGPGTDWEIDASGNATFASITTPASSNPAITLTDSDNNDSDIDFQIAIVDNASNDTQADFQVEVAGTMDTWLHLDGLNENIEFGDSTNVDSITLLASTTGDAVVVLPNDSVGAAEILDNALTAAHLNATLTMADGDLIDFSGGSVDSATEGILLPGHATSCASATGEGQICVDRDDNSSSLLWIGDGTTARNIGGGGGDNVSIDTVGVTDPDFRSTGDIDFIDTSNVVTADINTGAVEESHLNEASGTPTDGDVLTYNSGGTNFNWEEQSTLAAGTAAALAANGANCNAGEIPLGVNAAGAVEGCYEPTEADISGLDHTDTDAIHIDTADEFGGVAQKLTPVAADIVLIEDSAASWAKKYATVSSLQGVGSGDAVYVNTSAMDGADFTNTSQITWSVNTTPTPDLIYAWLDNTLDIHDGDYIDFGTYISSETEGLFLPAHLTDCSVAIGEGQVCWEEDDQDLYVGNGAGAVLINGGGSGDDVTVDSVDVTDPNFTDDGDLDPVLCTGSGTPDASCAASGDVLYRLNTSAINAITEIDATLKTGDAVKLVTGTAGTGGNCARWDATGNVVGTASSCFTSAGVTFEALENNTDIGFGADQVPEGQYVAPLADPVFTSSLQLPNGGSPTVDTAGEIAVDTTATYDQLVFYGDAKRVLNGAKSDCKTIELLTDADDNLMIMDWPWDVTIVAWGCATDGNAAGLVLADSGDNVIDNDGTTHKACDTDTVVTWDASLSGSANATITSGSEALEVDVYSESDPTWVKVCFAWTEDAQ